MTRHDRVIGVGKQPGQCEGIVDGQGALGSRRGRQALGRLGSMREEAGDAGGPRRRGQIGLARAG